MENQDNLKKYFNSKEYTTIVVGKEDVKNTSESAGDKITAIISLLTDPKNKDIKEETLVELKKENKGELLLAAIASPEANDTRHVLVAACWESEINFSKYLPFFITLSLDENYLVSLEAITVIENMEGPFDETHLQEGIKRVKEKQKTVNAERLVLLNDLVNVLEGFLSSSREQE